MNKEERLKKNLGIKFRSKEPMVKINWRKTIPVIVGIIIGLILLFVIYFKFVRLYT